MCHNELRSISRISQAVCIRSQTRSQPAPSNQSFPNTTVNGPPQAHAWALAPGLVCRPGRRLGCPCCRRAPAAGRPRGSPAGPGCRGRCVEGRRRGPGVGERGVVWRSGGGRSWPASDRGDGRLSREPAERAGVAPGPPPPGLCPGGPDDRSATGRRGGCPGLLAGLAGGVSSHPAATLPGPPAGRRVQQAASSLCADPVGALVPFEPSDPVCQRTPKTSHRRPPGKRVPQSTINKSKPTPFHTNPLAGFGAPPSGRF